MVAGGRGRCDPRFAAKRGLHPGTGCQKVAQIAQAAFWHPSGMQTHTAREPGVSLRFAPPFFHPSGMSSWAMGTRLHLMARMVVLTRCAPGRRRREICMVIPFCLCYTHWHL
jgi:hypothetical protein